MFRWSACLCLLLALPAASGERIGVDELSELTAPPPDDRVAYGSDPLQFGLLRLPDRAGPHPVLAFVHGGCWLSRWNIDHVAALEQALADAGYAVWSIEYRRVGDPGGGWPGSFIDVGAALDHLRELAPRHDLDLSRVVVAGHSAGAAFALWAAARASLPHASELHVQDPIPVGAVVGLAPALDLEAIERRDSCGDAVNRLMGGTPLEHPARYAAASPMQLAPIGVPQFLVIGAEDDAWAPTGQAYRHRAFALGDAVEATVVEGAGHFEPIVPGSAAWPAVDSAVAAAFDAVARRASAARPDR